MLISDPEIKITLIRVISILSIIDHIQCQDQMAQNNVPVVRLVDYRYVYCFSALCANKDIKGPIMMSHMLTENS